MIYDYHYYDSVNSIISILQHIQIIVTIRCFLKKTCYFTYMNVIILVYYQFCLSLLLNTYKVYITLSIN